MSVNFDSTFGFDPAVQDSSMAAMGWDQPNSVLDCTRRW